MAMTADAADLHGHRSKVRAPRKRGRAIDIAFVNNMPDNALHSTERQFRAVLLAAAGQTTVRLHLFAFPGIPRSEEITRHIASEYGSFDTLLSRSFDALIVTGNEPRAARLDQEPYWNDLTRLVDWADGNTRSSLWSCLAAHAAVLHLHGIERRFLGAKLSGVFECEVDRLDPLMESVSPHIAVPHSRWNEVGRKDLLANGYRILSESPEAGIDMFSLRKRSRFVFLQGHPEYDADTLLREYRRDAGRYLRGEAETYPNEPANYFSPEASAILRAFRRRALANRNPQLFDVFPNVASPFAITNRWRKTAELIYRNWIDEIVVTGARATTLP